MKTTSTTITWVEIIVKMKLRKFLES